MLGGSIVPETKYGLLIPVAVAHLRQPAAPRTIIEAKLPPAYALIGTIVQIAPVRFRSDNGHQRRGAIVAQAPEIPQLWTSTLAQGVVTITISVKANRFALGFRLKRHIVSGAFNGIANCLGVSNGPPNKCPATAIRDLAANKYFLAIALDGSPRGPPPNIDVGDLGHAHGGVGYQAGSRRPKDSKGTVRLTSDIEVAVAMVKHQRLGVLRTANLGIADTDDARVLEVDGLPCRIGQVFRDWGNAVPRVYYRLGKAINLDAASRRAIVTNIGDIDVRYSRHRAWPNFDVFPIRVRGIDQVEGG
ncbi:MAG: hypothetical protein JW395_3326 [Nitrospira sp.]|nr:hypothetical protein [Nitrospira sp.]